MRWPLVPVGEFAEQIHRSEKVQPEQKYILLGMRSKVGGPFARETKSGAEISAVSLNKVAAGDFISSRLFAWQGSFGIIPDSLAGSHVSNEYPNLSAGQIEGRTGLSSLLVRFERDTEISRIEMSRLNAGTRNRYKEEYFLKLRAPLPYLEEQRRIVEKLDRVAALVDDRRQAIAAAEREAQALLLKAFQLVIDGAPLRPMSEVAPLVRKPVEIDLDASYSELGVRSFGRGTFHKPDLLGAEVGNKKLFRICAGDLLFNIVFAWEDAVAVAQPEDDGRVGSHRFLTCVPAPETATVEFLHFYFSRPEGLQKLGEASPGGAGRNRTLGLKKLENLQVPVPSIGRQQWFDRLQAKAHEARTIRANTAQDVEALNPAMLHEIFDGEAKAA